MPTNLGEKRMSKASSDCGTPRIFNLFQIVDRALKLSTLCVLVATFAPASSAEGQCVGAGPDGNADVSEACDDGNQVLGDGCTDTCTVEPEWSASNAITFSSGALNTNDYGSNSSWTFAGDNSWARQNNNTDGPSIGLFGVDAMRGTYALELEVETTSDDDFIGIVFGFNDGDPSNSSADYVLLDWKQQDQSAFGGFAAEGLALSHVQGIPSTGSFWAHGCPASNACVNELQRSAAFGDVGWTDDFPHKFHVTYRPDRLLVMVDGFVQFDISPSDFPGEFPGNVFPSGEIGFYSFSQESSTTRNIGTIGASVLNRTTVSDGDVYVTTGTGPSTVNVSDYFSDPDGDLLDPNLILVTGVTGSATVTDPTSGALVGTLELTPDDDTVPTSYSVTYTACDNHPIVPDCDTATVTVHYQIGCGNSIVETGEGCDDGNAVSLDGCSSTCFLEEGWGCALGSQCETGQCDAGGLGCVYCFDDKTGTAIDTGCDGIAPYCDASGARPFCDVGCADSGSGGTDLGCLGSDNACDESGSNPVCVDCMDTADCSPGDACDVSSNSCVEGCFEDSDCPDGNAPVCDTSDSSPGACVACINDQTGVSPDEGCTNAELPLCNGATGEAGSACVFCLDDMGSGAMDTGCTTAGLGLCDTSVAGGACVECLTDADCPGLKVCTDDGACDYPDSDDDGIRDDVDVDDDADGIVDTEEGGGTDWSLDDDGDGVPDYTDPDAVSCADEEPDGICDSLPTDVDADGDGLPNHLDLDSDADGLPDTTEGHDDDGDGLADSVAVGDDDDGDGLDDAFDADCAGMPGGCAADGIVAPVPDRDGDGAPDYLDADSDNDGLLDRVEGFDGDADGEPEALPSGMDVDGDGLDDAFDIDQGGIGATGQDRDGDDRPDYIDQDSDGDGIADRVECADPTGCTDSDGDGAPDFLDTDSDDDGIEDKVEGHDGDADGAPDFEPLGMDDDEDGLDDAYDLDMAGGVPATTPDHDADGTPDYQDPDDDGDGVGSTFECPDPLSGCPDGDSDGTPDYLDPDDLPADTDGDGIPDEVECAGNIAGCVDTDDDGNPDHMDPDDDDDGVPTATECGVDPAACDADGDGNPNHRDIDSDGDGITDTVECSTTASCEDTDSDGTPDYLDEDSDGDGIVDLIEGHDADMNGVADRAPLDADTDGDGLDDAFDTDNGGTSAPTQNTDGDAVPDFQDPDDDDDGSDTVFECADPGAVCPDGDNDGTPDYLDDDNTPLDTDGDGIPNVVECPAPGDPVGAPENCPDTDEDGDPDFDDPDDDEDGIDTADENYDGDNDPTNEDSDGDGKPDYLDEDDDDDGVPTADECPDFAAGCSDSDGDGKPDYLDVCGDDTRSLIDLASGWEECDDGNAVDGDGCDSSCRRESDVPDSDGDGIPDTVECPAPGNPLQPSSCPDSDDDGTPDFDDDDDDGDGIPTADESPDGDSDPTDDDTDGDDTPNYLDKDDDGDGIDTAQEREDSTTLGDDDPDGDGLVNWLDTDSDGDGIADGDEAGDENDNGIPDYLEELGEPQGPGRLLLTGGRGVGCSVGTPGQGGPSVALLLLILGFGLAIRRYRRN